MSSATRNSSSRRYVASDGSPARGSSRRARHEPIDIDERLDRARGGDERIQLAHEAQLASGQPGGLGAHRGQRPGPVGSIRGIVRVSRAFVRRFDLRAHVRISRSDSRVVRCLLARTRGQARDQATESVRVHGREHVRNLENLLKVVVRRAAANLAAVGPILAPALNPVFGLAEHLRVVLVQRAHEPAGIDGHHDHEQAHTEQQMHGLQDLDHARGRTAIEIVDVQDDAVDKSPIASGGRIVVSDQLGRRCGRPLRTQKLRQRIEIALDQADGAEVLAIVIGVGALAQKAQ